MRHGYKWETRWLWIQRCTMVDGLRRALGFLTVYPLRASDAWTPETLGSPWCTIP